MPETGFVYLSGRMTDATEHDLRDWYAIEKLCEHNKVSYFSPRLNPLGETTPPMDIVNHDCEKINNAACVLVVNGHVPSWGSAMEVAHAFHNGVAVFFVADDPARVSPWLRAHSTKGFHNPADAVLYLAGWLDAKV